MAINVVETPDGRSQQGGRDESESRMYKIHVTGDEDELDVIAALLAEAPDNVVGISSGTPLNRVSYKIQERKGGVYYGTVEYGLADPREPDEYTINWTTSGGSMKLTQALEHIGDFAREGDTAPPTHGCINIKAGGEVEGVEIETAVLDFSITRRLSDAVATLAFWKTIAGMTPSMNNAPFLGFAAGELKFRGAHGSKRGQDQTEVTWEFSASQNATNLNVDGIIIPSKLGWDYVWVQSRAVQEDTFLVARAQSAHVERVVRFADFSQLRTGAA